MRNKKMFYEYAYIKMMTFQMVSRLGDMFSLLHLIGNIWGNICRRCKIIICYRYHIILLVFTSKCLFPVDNLFKLKIMCNLFTLVPLGCPIVLHLCHRNFCIHENIKFSILKS